MKHKITTTQELIETFNERSASLFLALLFCGDLAFVALHVMNALMLKNPLLNLTTDRGFPEIYQDLKFLWICTLLIFASLKYASRHYVAWVLLFAYFLLDDSLGVHEQVGHYIAANVSFVPPLGPTLQDYGELTISAVAGMILLPQLVWAYKKGARMFRKVSQDLALLVALLIFFGVVLDMAHSAIDLGREVNFVLCVIEEGGEMLSASLILWYVFLIMVRDSYSGRLCDWACTVLTRRST